MPSSAPTSILAIFAFSTVASLPGNETAPAVPIEIMRSNGGSKIISGSSLEEPRWGVELGITDQITSNGITWTFADPATYGTFITGDFWILGPVTVTGITNDLNSASFTPREGQNGSMLNPLIGHARDHQGYDDGLNSYEAALNVGRPGEQPLSPANPLTLQPDDTLISMVSWLYNSATDKEPGCPAFNGGTNAPRPVTRSGAILTVLGEPPPDGSFRPPYAGNDNTVRYNFADLDWTRLKNLEPPAHNLPSLSSLEAGMKRPWIDHVFEYLGAMIHPSEHMPNYGRDMGKLALQTALMLHLDFDQLPGAPTKDQLLINLVQYGIDSTGIADNGGGWRANGGHGLGRKWPILFAGLMLDQPHMQNVGTWGRHDGTSSGAGTEFQEFQNCFYVSQVEVDLTHSESWKPDSRDVAAGEALPYEEEDIGTPEWGIRHSYRPTSDNAHLDSNYRDINAGVHPGFALAAHLMGAETLWNHDAFLDYCDRIMDLKKGGSGTNGLPPFAIDLWNNYRDAYDTRVNYENFMALHFSPEELLNATLVGDDQDPDLDGRSNLEEYFFQTDPRNPDQTEMSVHHEPGGSFSIRLRRVNGVNGVECQWESSVDLLGEWAGLDPDGLRLLSNNGNSEMLEYLFSASGAPAPRFFRLRLSR